MTDENEPISAKLAHLLDRLRRCRVLVVGDVMLDSYVEGRIARTAPDNGVEVLEQVSVRTFPGGAANVAMNVAGLGGAVRLVGVVGTDTEAETLRAHLDRGGVRCDDIVPLDGRPTTLKQRLNAGSRLQLRVDREVASDLADEAVAGLCDRIGHLVARSDIVVVSDYGKGVVGSRTLAAVMINAREAGVPVLVDPKGTDFTRYAGASYLTPNAPELAGAAGGAMDALAVRRLVSSLGGDGIVVTEGSNGARLVTAEVDIAFPVTPVEQAETAGAGDSFIAMFTIALASGLSAADGVQLANLAARRACEMPFTATVTLDALRGAVQPVRSARQSQPPDKIAIWRGLGLTVGFTNGCFDVLHAGHIHLLEEARRHCDRLVVAINTDESVRQLKGPDRPVHALDHRIRALQALRAVDLVVPFADATPQRLIEAIRPDVLVKGADYTVETVVGAEFVVAHGGRVLLVDLVPGLSTTAVLAHGARWRS